MKSIKNLNLGFTDAENYKLKDNRDLQRKYFYKDFNLDKLLMSHVTFLIGEKGTGKTAYAVYLSNNEYKNTTSTINQIRESEYSRFYNLMEAGQIKISSYPEIWKVILLLLIIKNIKEQNIVQSLSSKIVNYFAIEEAIDEFYAGAFSPEIQTAINIIEESTLAAGLTHSKLKAEGLEKHSVNFSESRMQINLLYLEKKFKECISSIKLNKSHILFIDGIDIRPGLIPFNNYLECIKGLVNAAWSLNIDFLCNTKSAGKMKVVLLLRPDIFHSLALHNSTNKLTDNSVFLDWRTTYPSYRSSAIFALTDRMLSAQQDLNLKVGEAWDTYFPYRLPATNPNREYDNSFTSLLRYSFSRPRDVIRIMEIMRDRKVDSDKKIEFAEADFSKSDVLNDISEYLMGSIKDQLDFYYTPKEYESFKLFFIYLDGFFEFNYETYCKVYKKFISDKRVKNNHPSFFNSEVEFLQFLYELNVLCYMDFNDYKEPLFCYCYRERDLSNFHPKIKLDSTYKIHYGLRKALHLHKNDRSLYRNVR